MKFSETLKQYLELREQPSPKYSALDGGEEYARRCRVRAEQLAALEAQLDEIVEGTFKEPDAAFYDDPRNAGRKP